MYPKRFEFKNLNTSKENKPNFISENFNCFLSCFLKVVGPAIWYLYGTAHFRGNYAMLKEGDKPNVDNLWILDDNSLTGVKKV